MIISNCELYEFEKNLRIPMPRTGIATRKGIYVRLITQDGRDAYGEISPLPGFSAESLPGASEQAIWLAGEITNMSVTGDILKTDTLESEDLFSSVSCGFELAIWKLFRFGSKSETQPDATSTSFWLTPLQRPLINICALLAGSAEEVSSQARSRIRQGYRTFKLKVGNSDPDRDIALIRQVSGIIGSDSQLRLDANRAWSIQDAMYVFENTVDLDFEFVEEPLHEFSEYPTLVEAIPVPVALDESIDDVLNNHLSAEPSLFEMLPWLRALVLKPMIRGGFRKSMRIAKEAIRYGIEPVISSSFESRTGFGGLVLLAGSAPGGGLASGLDTLHYFQSEAETEGSPIIDVGSVGNRSPKDSVYLNRIL